MIRFKALLLAAVVALSGLAAVHSTAQAAGGGVALKALANQFSVSPDMLQKFSKMGLSNVDLSNGLQLAKSIVGKGELNIAEAAEQVLSLKGEGQDWAQIAKDFGVDLPDFSAGDAMEKLQKMGTE